MDVRRHVRAAGWSFWVPCVLAILAFIATIAAAIEPQWIEELFGASPDEGSGESEWWIAALLAAFGVAATLVARWRWRAVPAAAAA